MLDNETKHRLDTLRDILVGKVPDPKSQVDQITTGLIYKFMNDMDTASVKAGGKRKFFKGEFRMYSWEKLFDPKVGGVERVKLYGEAIERMCKNPSAPPLFREIFKNTYLPFRDPSTLNMFLTEIGEFHYTHSEKLGDAYEYLLSYMGSQGDAGQFRTPRHIIDFIVEIVNPRKNETILDPACGTAGFLVSSFKHIMRNKKKLRALDLNKLSENLVGYDIAPDMTRMSLVNMYLHRFTNPKIYEYDTLSSEDRWNEYFDVILANPPFFSPKGGIQPHSRFGVDSKRAEVLFVDYIIQHLKPNGRAGIIVPEGIIFQTGRAYNSLRKKLVDDCLVGVISLPAGVFQPYSGVKTSILILDKKLARVSDKIFFPKIKNDGFSLNSQRTPISNNDLPATLAKYQLFAENLSLSEQETISRSKIARNKECSLSVSNYLALSRQKKSGFNEVSITEISKFYRGVTYKKSQEVNQGGIKILRANNISLDGNILLDEVKSVSDSVSVRPEQWLKGQDILMCIASGSKEHIGKTALIENDINFAFGGFMGVLRTFDDILPKFLYRILQQKKFNNYLADSISGTNINNIKLSILSGFRFPLPPIEIQREIVNELDGYQKIIDGARQVVENYSPCIDIDPNWNMEELGNLCKLHNGRAYKKDELLSYGQYPVLRVGNFFTNSKWYYSDLELETNKYCDNGDLLYAWSASFGAKIWNGGKVIYHYHIWKVEPNITSVSKFFLKYLLDHLTEQFKSEGGRGGIMMHLTKSGMEKTRIPLPPLDIQDAITKRLSAEEELIEGNKQLIQIYTKKIQDRIAKVWGE